MLVTRGLGGIRPSAVVFGLGRYSSVTPPTPTPSGGGGSKGKKPWRVDYLEDYPGYIRPAPAPAVTKPPRRRKSVNLTGPNVTPLELLTSLGVALPEFVPDFAPVTPAPAILAKPAEIKINLDMLITQYQARMDEAERVERINRLKRQNAAAFLLLM
jgi:hypothetical protein